MRKESIPNIPLKFMDDSLGGRIGVRLNGWTGRIYLVPRSKLEESKTDTHDNMAQDLSRAMLKPGIYILLGTNFEDGYFIYVGQSTRNKNDGGVLARILQHNDEEKLKNYTHAIIITNTDDFTEGDLNYLENKFTTWAKDIPRHIHWIKCCNDYTKKYLSDAAYDFFSKAKPIVHTLVGYAFFSCTNESQAEPTQPSEQPSSEQSSEKKDIGNGQPLFYLKPSKTEGVHGVGYKDNDDPKNGKFWVQKGSMARPKKDETATCPQGTKELRDKLTKDKIIVDNEFKENYKFSSPSAAAELLLGRSANGQKEWKTKDNKTLKEIYQKSTASTDS